MNRAGAGPATLQPVIFGEFHGCGGVFDVPGPDFGYVERVQTRGELDGVDEFVAVFAGGEDAVWARAGVGLDGAEGEEGNGEEGNWDMHFRMFAG